METQPQEVNRRRVRRRSIKRQIQIALDDAAKASAADISTQKLIQTRIDCLLKLEARERNDKIRKFNDELKIAKSEIERLKQELAAAIAKPVADPVAAALAKHDARVGGV